MINEKKLKEIFARSPYDTKNIPPTERAISYCISGLLTDGAHHKQWFLEQTLKALGVDIVVLTKIALDNDYGWEKGIAP
jgi:hypothetical protein